MAQYLFLTILVLFVCSDDAFAYVDPGVGHVLWQLVAASALGTIFLWKRLMEYCGRIFKRLAERTSKK